MTTKAGITHKYSEATDLTDVVLIVEDQHFHVSKVVLMLASPVFKIMFTGKFKEAETSEVTLKGKTWKAVEWMLDYLYPNVEFNVTESKALKLLRLAEEYQISNLKKDCVEQLMKLTEPKLEVVALAQQCNVESLLNKAIEGVARTLSAVSLPPYSYSGFQGRLGISYNSRLSEELALPENQCITQTTLNRIYLTKLRLAKELLKEVRNGQKKLSDIQHQLDNLL